MKNTNENTNKQKKNKKPIGKYLLIAIAVLFVLIVAVELIGKMTAKKVDTKEGLAIIKKAEAADVVAVETKIQKIEDKERKENDTRSLKEKFASTVVMGDSITDGFQVYDVLNASSVVSKIGVELTSLDDQIARLKELNPQVIFMSYGMNDIISTQGDTKLFVKHYKAVIKQIQKELPNTKIFINSIFPVQQQAIAGNPVLEKAGEYNMALSEMCDKMKIAYVDNTELAQEQYYEGDGIHYKPEFYPIWAERMAEVAAL